MSFAALPGNRDAISTVAGPIVVSLPEAPVVGQAWEALDGGGTWATNNVTISGFGELIMGSAADFSLNVNHATARFVFVGGAIGWAVTT